MKQVKDRQMVDLEKAMTTPTVDTSPEAVERECVLLEQYFGEQMWSPPTWNMLRALSQEKADVLAEKDRIWTAYCGADKETRELRARIQELEREKADAQAKLAMIRNDALEEAKVAAGKATLPEGFHWGEDAMEQFDFGKERAALAIDALKSQSSPTPATNERKLEVDAFILDVSELPDRTSPEDEPEMMLVTEKELRSLFAKHFNASSSEGRSHG